MSVAMLGTDMGSLCFSFYGVDDFGAVFTSDVSGKYRL